MHWIFHVFVGCVCVCVAKNVQESAIAGARRCTVIRLYVYDIHMRYVHVMCMHSLKPVSKRTLVLSKRLRNAMETKSVSIWSRRVNDCFFSSIRVFPLFRSHFTVSIWKNFRVADRGKSNCISFEIYKKRRNRAPSVHHIRCVSHANRTVHSTSACSMKQAFTFILNTCKHTNRPPMNCLYAVLDS